MVDAPEKIWFVPDTFSAYSKPADDYDVEYTRSDLVAELAAENERLKKEVENWKTSAAGWQKIANVDAEAFSHTDAVKVKALLNDIACWSQTAGLLWWQIKAREALSALASHPRDTSTVEDHETANVSDKPEGQQEPVAFQQRVQPWMIACFGPEVSSDRLERADRFIEEAIELLQSGGYPRERIAALTDYVYGREVGEPAQEAGGVMVTLAAYCLAHDLDMQEAAEAELERIWTKVEQIRVKQAAKPVGSALPVSSTRPSEQAVTEAMVEAALAGWHQAIIDAPYQQSVNERRRHCIRAALKAAMEAGHD